jgi:hypothetical protein
MFPSFGNSFFDNVDDILRAKKSPSGSESIPAWTVCPEYAQRRRVLVVEQIVRLPPSHLFSFHLSVTPFAHDEGLAHA